MSLPKLNGWQLSRDKEPAVVARTCPLWNGIQQQRRELDERGSYNTSGDLIFSARRVRLALFHACVAALDG